MAVIDGIYQHLEGTQNGISSIAIKHEIAYATDIDALVYKDINDDLHIFKEAPTHATLSSLQGGTTGQYYHLTTAQYTNLGYVLAPAAPLTISNNALRLNIDSDYFSIVANELTIAETTKTIRYANSVVITDNYDLVTKGYLDSMVQGATWLHEVITFYEPNETLPFEPNIGDRYISTATANGWTINNIYEWNGSSWTATVPTSGDIVPVTDPVYDAAYQFTGTTWRSLSAVTLHSSLQGLQGGASSEYYHLSAAVYNNIVNLNPVQGDIIVGGNGVPFATITGLKYTSNTLQLPYLKISNNSTIVDDTNLVIMKDVSSFTGTKNIVITDTSAIDASESIIIGRGATFNGTGLYRCTIIGRSAAGLASNLSQSCCFGNYSGYNAYNSYYMVNIGDSTGYNSPNSNYIINIGYRAGYQSTSASITNNINIGTQAGQYSTGSGCINIGYSAGLSNTIADKLFITNQNGTNIISGTIGDAVKRVLTFNVAEINVNQMTTNTQVLTATSGIYVIDCDLGSYIYLKLVTGLTTIQLNNLRVGTNIQLELKQITGTPLNSVNIVAYTDAGITQYPIKRKPNNQSLITVTSDAVDLLSISTGKTASSANVVNIVSANMVAF